MSHIPVHMQRKFEQRWAARFVTSAESATPQKQWPENRSRRPANAQEKPAGLSRRAQSLLSQYEFEDPRLSKPIGGRLTK
jgi:hypothetical protein